MNDNYFERFWSCYPNKKGKGQARRAFEKAFKDVSLEDQEPLIMKIVLSVDAQVRHRKQLHRNNQFCPDWKAPSTWINGQCWLDEFQEIEEKKPHYHYKEPCSQCKHDGVVKVNEKQYCAWHYSKEFCNEGDTGLNRLREAYKTKPVPKLKDETPYEYFIRVCGSKQVKASLDSRNSGQGKIAFPAGEGN
ncbi:MAG: hypothetical protein PHE50_00065 [Dehalococcoidales bacterium]|nr:hypothetical protein [Dehalococcoidales bacterium]